MSMEVPHCTDCGAPLKAVPAWLATAKVSFTCAACPRRSTRGGAARYDSPAEPRSASLAEADVEDVEDLDEVEDVEEIDASADEADDYKDDADL